MYALIVTLCILADNYQHSGETVPLSLVSMPNLKHWYPPSHIIQCHKPMSTMWAYTSMKTSNFKSVYLNQFHTLSHKRINKYVLSKGQCSIIKTKSNFFGVQCINYMKSNLPCFQNFKWHTDLLSFKMIKYKDSAWSVFKLT